MKNIFLVLAAICLGTVYSSAGGSLDTKQVTDILKKDTVIWTQVLAPFELDTTAWGLRCGTHWPHLGGARIAPYTVLMRPKGAVEYSLLLTVECEQRFIDKNGKELAKDANGSVTDEIINQSVRVEEKVSKIIIEVKKPEKAQASQ